MTNRTKTKGSGRKKGTPNKLTHETRGLLREALAGELDTLPETLAGLAPQQRFDAVLKLLKYILPPLEAVTVNQVDKATLDPEYHKSCMETEIVTDRAEAKFIESLNSNLYPDV